MWRLPAISKQILKARAAHIRATIDMPYPYRDLIAHHRQYTISEWRWFLEYSPVILAPYVDRSGQEVRRIVIAKALCFATRPSAQAFSDNRCCRRAHRCILLWRQCWLAAVHARILCSHALACPHSVCRLHRRCTSCTPSSSVNCGPTCGQPSCTTPQTQMKQITNSSNRRTLTHICLTMPGWQNSTLVQPS